MRGLNDSAAGIFKEFARQKDDLKWYAIADSAQHAQLPEALVEDLFEKRCLLGSTPGSPLAKKSPHLVQLKSPIHESKAWRWLRLNSRVSPCVSIIATHKTFDDAFKQFQNCTEVSLSDGEIMCFAFWDPAILGSLVGQHDDHTLHIKGPVLSREQRSVLMQGLVAWWYWDREGALHVINLNKDMSVPVNNTIKLNQHQVDDLIEASVPDHILYYLSLNQPEIIGEIPPEKRYEAVRAALLHARNIGLLGMRDLVDFVCLHFIYKERLCNDSKIAGLLNCVKSQQLSLRGVIADFP